MWTVFHRYISSNNRHSLSPNNSSSNSNSNSNSSNSSSFSKHSQNHSNIVNYSLPALSAARYAGPSAVTSGAAGALPPSDYHRIRYLPHQQLQPQQHGQHVQQPPPPSHLMSSASGALVGGGHKSYAPASLPLDLGSHMASSLGGLVIPDQHVALSAMSGSFLPHNLPPGAGGYGKFLPLGGAGMGPSAGGNSLGVIGGPQYLRRPVL
uniref:Uncharacterized protein n=1 Tax=Anopheles atroparvus TaxID=41427 RepID=A0A182IL40_ANOAO